MLSTVCINYPDLQVPRSTDVRVCVMHKNIPNMLSQISGLVSEAGVNIDNMTNRSRKEYAYTILDVVSDLPADCIQKINAIDGVIRVRKI